MSMEEPNSTNRLEALADMTATVDAENPSMEARQQEAAEVAAATESEIAAKQWGMFMFTLGGFAQMLAPELKPVYSEERCFAWGQQANAVAEKYGWNGPSAMPEVALIASTAGFFVPSWLVIKQKLSDHKEAKEGTLAGKLALWWRHRKAQREAQREAKRAQAGAAEVLEGADHGVEQ